MSRGLCRGLSCKVAHGLDKHTLLVVCTACGVCAVVLLCCCCRSLANTLHLLLDQLVSKDACRLATAGLHRSVCDSRPARRP